jgi:hypothetical protein
MSPKFPIFKKIFYIRHEDQKKSLQPPPWTRKKLGQVLVSLSLVAFFWPGAMQCSGASAGPEMSSYLSLGRGTKCNLMQQCSLMPSLASCPTTMLDLYITLSLSVA